VRLALDDLRKIDTFISNKNPPAAKKVLSTIWETTRLLKEHPQIGIPGRVAGMLRNFSLEQLLPLNQVE
jgi:plasmid stabilization system protein ParE